MTLFDFMHHHPLVVGFLGFCLMCVGITFGEAYGKRGDKDDK